MISRIHVNQHLIRANVKQGTNVPCIAIRTSKGVTYARQVRVGDVVIKQDFEHPLSCGAKVWIETQGNVEVLA